MNSTKFACFPTNIMTEKVSINQIIKHINQIIKQQLILVYRPFTENGV